MPVRAPPIRLWDRSDRVPPGTRIAKPSAWSMDIDAVTPNALHARSQSIVAEAMALARLMLLALGNRLRLLGFELQIAGVKLAAAAALIVIALFLLGTAWAVLWLGVAMALRSVDLDWAVVVALIFAINAAGAAISLLAARRLARQIGLPATLRQLSFAESSEDDGPPG